MNLKRLQSIIEKIGEELPPEDDWMPTLIIEGRKENTIYGFVGDPMGGDRAKDETARKITECVSQSQPDCACFITTAWSLNFEKEKMDEFEVELWKAGATKIRDHPKRVEIVNAYIYGVRGSNKGEVLMVGYIQRHPDKGPTIRKWEIMRKKVSTEGRFPDAVKKGFQLAKGG